MLNAESLVAKLWIIDSSEYRFWIDVREEVKISQKESNPIPGVGPEDNGAFDMFGGVLPPLQSKPRKEQILDASHTHNKILT